MSRNRNLMLFVNILIVFSLIFISFIPVGVSDTITNFGNPSDPTKIEYSLALDKEEDVALDATGYFTIPTHRGEIKSASLNIECKADSQGNYLTNPGLDIGLDGDYEWEFSGKGYGDAGHQTKFHTGGTTRTVITAKRGGQNFDNRMKTQ